MLIRLATERKPNEDPILAGRGSDAWPAVVSRMTSIPTPPAEDPSEEISVLMRTLRETDQRLHELIAHILLRDLSIDPRGRAPVSAIINLAHSLKVNVVAEGVETAQQSHLLRLTKCREMQGCLFSVPVTRQTFDTRNLVPALLATAPHSPDDTAGDRSYGF